MRTSKSADFFVSVLNSLTEQIAVIDAKGLIQWVNHSWEHFSATNDGRPGNTLQGSNYLRVCRAAQAGGDQSSEEVLAGIEAVIRGEQPTFYFEYPCHSPTEQRWFMMRICAQDGDGAKHFVVSHQNITERKLTELRHEELATLDGLTGIPNRRSFDDFLDDEWRRAHRLGLSVSLALFDIDFFKPYNDNYGHIAGDECLRRASTALVAFARRPGDLVARYGGEEFAFILGNSEHAAACELADQMRTAIQALDIPHEYATQAGCVTMSGGVATLRPNAQTLASPSILVKAADLGLYEAKEGGRNRICAYGITDMPPDAFPKSMSRR